MLYIYSIFFIKYLYCSLIFDPYYYSCYVYRAILPNFSMRQRLLLYNPNYFNSVDTIITDIDTIKQSLLNKEKKL